ncbi:unnamed protein product, partial [Closterium sp. NIES-65]
RSHLELRLVGSHVPSHLVRQPLHAPSVPPPLASSSSSLHHPPIYSPTISARLHLSIPSTSRAPQLPTNTQHLLHAPCAALFPPLSNLHSLFPPPLLLAG